ncbi:MAG: hypothetical protein WCJ29_00740 [bacterium]
MTRVFKLLFKIFWLPALVLALQLCRQKFLYGHDDIDPIAHFFGGLAIAHSAFIVVKAIYGKLKIPTLFMATFLIMSGVYIGVFWEWYEYIRFHNDPTMVNWPWWPDTLYDLFMDMIGAGSYALTAAIRKRI